MASRRSAVKGKTKPVSEEELRKYVEIDTADIVKLYTRFTNTSVMQTIFQIAMNGLIGGGISVSSNGMDMNQKFKDYVSLHWSVFTEAMVRDLWVVGFVACTTVKCDSFVATPHVIDLLQTRIFYKKSVLGISEYALFDNTRGIKVGPMGLGEQITDLTIFEFSPPSHIGKLTSKLVSVENDLLTYELITRVYVEATIRRANPVIVLEDSSNITGADTAIRAAAFGNESLGARGVNDTFDGPLDRLGDRMSQNNVYQTAHSRLLARGLAARNISSSAFEVYHADQNKTVATGIGIPQAPVDRENLRVAVEEHIGSIFGVPRAMFAQASSGRVSSNDDIRLVFRDGQLNLKQKITAYLKVVWMHIYGDIHLARAVTEEKGGGKGKTSDLVPDVDISLPGIPPVALLRDLYTLGVLKYKKFTESIAMMLSIPPTHFEETPIVTGVGDKDAETGRRKEHTSGYGSDEDYDEQKKRRKKNDPDEHNRKKQ